MENTLPKFTGQQVKYYAFCKRRLWLFTRGLEMELENEDVQKGTLIDESSYQREHKTVSIDNRIVIDWIGSKVLADGTLLIHETKKSRSFDNAHRLQVLYYLYYLKQKGVAARGEINYPLLKRREEVELTPEAEAELQEVLCGLKQIIESAQAPPKLANRRLCQKCAYYELCWS